MEGSPTVYSKREGILALVHLSLCFCSLVESCHSLGGDLVEGRRHRQRFVHLCARTHACVCVRACVRVLLVTTAGLSVETANNVPFVCCKVLSGL